MLVAMKRKTPRKPAGRRDDGAATRAQILEAAGEVFSEMGFDRATGKEIAKRAGANSAAINYYFGGIEGLYAEVLVEAHRRLLTYDRLLALADASGEPADRLRTIMDTIARAIIGPASPIWSLRVLSREILSPSPAFPVLLERELLPKKRIATGLVGAMLQLPHDDPAVSRCWLSIFAPFAMLLVANRRVLAEIWPGLDSDPDAAEAIIDHFQRFAFGGLAAVAAELRAKDGTSPHS